jgi:prepilin-type N-terminal cleavage/methylation domain-containing protein
VRNQLRATLPRATDRGSARPVRAAVRSRRAFSLVEMLIALAICAALLTASLSALDASFRSYQVTTESASTNIISRIVVQRMLAMIRTGTDFGPYPLDVLDVAQNPVVSNSIEFVSVEVLAANYRQITRIETVEDEEADDGSFILMLTLEDHNGDDVTSEQHPLLRGVRDATFTLQYDIGPRLRLATVDLTVQPDTMADAGMRMVDTDSATIRLVASSSPRRIGE